MTDAKVQANILDACIALHQNYTYHGNDTLTVAYEEAEIEVNFIYDTDANKVIVLPSTPNESDPSNKQLDSYDADGISALDTVDELVLDENGKYAIDRDGKILSEQADFPITEETAGTYRHVSDDADVIYHALKLINGDIPESINKWFQNHVRSISK